MSDIKQLLIPDGIHGVEFVRVSEKRGPEARYTLPEVLTVAEWREAQQVTVKGDDKHTLRQFRMATLLLEVAHRDGVPEDVVLMPALGVATEINFEEIPRFFRGADGAWWLKQPGVVIDFPGDPDQPPPAA